MAIDRWADIKRATLSSEVIDRAHHEAVRELDEMNLRTLSTTDPKNLARLI